MKSSGVVLIIISCLMSFTFTLYPLSLVFIHIGQNLPSYLPDALFQARLFSKGKIFLIANKNALNQYVDDKKLSIQKIAIESIPKTKAHEVFIKASTLDHNFRGGFWLYASERFLVLDDFMQQYNEAPLVHMENDTLLYTNLEELEPVLMGCYPGIAAVFDNDERCIPCFVYVANKKVMHNLANLFVQLAPSGKNDMQVLSFFKKEYKEMIDNLPLIMSKYVDKHSLKDSVGRGVSDPTCYWKNIDLFNSIFDAAALGQYLGGIDPRNALLGPGFINESCVFNPSHLQFEWIVDNKGRKIPFAVFEDEKYRINTLHIHCKDLKKFLSRQKE